MGVFVKFSEQTCLHGFNFILHSPHWIPAVFYGILIVISTAMMVRDAILLAQKYQSEITKLDLTIVNNKTFDLGEPTMCLVPVAYYGNTSSTVTWDNKYLVKSTKTKRLELVINESATTLDVFLFKYNYNITQILREVSSLVNNSEFDTWYTKEKAKVFSVIYQTVATIGAVEARLLSTNSTWLSYTSEGQSEVVRQYLITKQIDFFQLNELIALIACRRTLFQFQNSQNFCSIAKLTWSGFTDHSFPYDGSPKICYRFPPKYFTFQSNADFLMLSFSGLYTIGKSEDEMCHVFLDFLGRNAFYTKYSQAAAINLCRSQQQTVKVRIDSEVQSLNLARKPCQNYDKLECETKCELNFYMANCDCYPVTIMTDVRKPTEMPYCTTLQFMDLSKKTVNSSSIKATRLLSCKSEDDTIAQCKDKCPQECNTRQIRFTYANIVSAYTAGASFAVETKLLISKFEFRRFEEALLLSGFDVFMSLGGSIGFWLGGSLIAFINVGVFFIATWAISIRSRRKNPKAEPTPHSDLLPGGYPDLKNSFILTPHT